MSVYICDQGHIIIDPPFSQEFCTKCGGNMHAGPHITALFKRIEECKQITKEMFKQFSRVVYNLSCGARSIKRKDTSPPDNPMLFIGDGESIPVFNQLRRFVSEFDERTKKVEIASTRKEAMKYFLELVEFAEEWRDELADRNGWPAIWID